LNGENASDEHGTGNKGAIGTRRAWIFTPDLLTACFQPWRATPAGLEAGRKPAPHRRWAEIKIPIPSAI